MTKENLVVVLPENNEEREVLESFINRFDIYWDNGMFFNINQLPKGYYIRFGIQNDCLVVCGIGEKEYMKPEFIKVPCTKINLHSLYLNYESWFYGKDVDDNTLTDDPQPTPTSTENDNRYLTQSGKQLYDVFKDDLLTPEQLEGFYLANVYKYVKRYKHKNGIKDLEKAKDYIDQLILLENE